MINIALLGAGRIGKMHAAIIAAHPRARLSYVFDQHRPSAEEVASKWGAVATNTTDQILSDDQLDAVLIATTTDTHVELIIKAARAGKAILCEKPIDLDIDKVEQCWNEIKSLDVPIQIGFNRRFDPSHSAVRAGVECGEVGRLETLVITSRDPGLPPLDYVKHSGGLFRDMMIHDFDMARFISDEDVVEITALGNALIDPQVAAVGDVDTAMVMMKLASGGLCHINCSRRAVYGYDQRIEAFGSAGMIQSNNHTRTSVTRYTQHSTSASEPLKAFFIDRYRESYECQLEAFIDALEAGAEVSPSFSDGRKALLLANAAYESMTTGKTVVIEY